MYFALRDAGHQHGWGVVGSSARMWMAWSERRSHRVASHPDLRPSASTSARALFLLRTRNNTYFVEEPWTSNAKGDGWWSSRSWWASCLDLGGGCGAGRAERRWLLVGRGGRWHGLRGKTAYTVTLAESRSARSSIDVPAGKQITIHLQNKGAMRHDFKVEGITGVPHAPGSSTDVVIGRSPATPLRGAPVAGHKEPA